MIAILILGGLAVLMALAIFLAAVVSAGWWVAVAVVAALLVPGTYDVVRRRHTILRNYPVMDHGRYALESLRPELQQYFVESEGDGRPFLRDTRSIIYERAKGVGEEKAFGTERDVGKVGYEFLLHSAHPAPQLDDPPRVSIGGPDCTTPYDMALLNVSAMSLGALSANAILVLNRGAQMGGFAHDTGEGGLSQYHLRHGGDLVWEIGTGYFMAICKAMLDEGITPDFITADGAEGGTGAAPLEFEDNVGTPLTEGLIIVHNALVGCGLRNEVRIGAGGKVATGADLVKRMAQGADYANAARPMMMAIWCIQAKRCQTNTCPAGVATQDPNWARALDVGDASHRVQRYQAATVAQALQLVSAMGLPGPEALRPRHLIRRTEHATTPSYAELFEWLEPGQLLAEPPETWAADWADADPDTFSMHKE